MEWTEKNVLNTVEREILYIQYTATPLLRGRRGPGEKKIYYGLHYIHATVVQIDLSQVFTYRIVFLHLCIRLTFYFNMCLKVGMRLMSC